MGNGSSTGISPLVTVFFNIARVLPAATRFILKAVRSWTKRQSHDIITWFGIDNKLGEAYIHMLDCVKDMLASDEKLLMKMVIEIINIIRSSDNPPSLVDAAGAILVEKHNIFRYKNAFSNSNVESIMSIIMQKGVPTSGLLDQHEQLTESEQMLEKTKAILNTLKNELLEENLVDVFKSHVENNHLLEMYDDLVAFVQSLTDAESIVEDALNAGFQSLQFFVDFSHSSTALVQGGISISLKGLLLLLKNETYEEFEDRVLASFHCGHSTAENFLPGGCSFALHTDDPHNIDGFSLCLGVDPDTTGPLQEISTSCPLTWDPTYCILPHQYSIGITSGHTLPKGVDCCVIIYEISTKTNMEMFSTSSNEESTQLDAAIPSSTMARNSLNPSAYYSNFEWSELRSMSDGNGDTNWITLGWSEDMWDMQCALPQSSNTAFSDLTDVEKEAVRGLGFTPKTWDAPTSMEAWRSVSPNEYWFQYEWDTVSSSPCFSISLLYDFFENNFVLLIEHTKMWKILLFTFHKTNEFSSLNMKKNYGRNSDGVIKSPPSLGVVMNYLLQ
jgi:hypothetical protein